MTMISGNVIGSGGQSLATENIRLIGDVNFDGVVDEADFKIVNKMLSDIEKKGYLKKSYVDFLSQNFPDVQKFTMDEYLQADLNGDGKIDYTDYTLLGNFISGGDNFAIRWVNTPYNPTIGSSITQHDYRNKQAPILDINNIPYYQSSTQNIIEDNLIKEVALEKYAPLIDNPPTDIPIVFPPHNDIPTETGLNPISSQGQTISETLQNPLSSISTYNVPPIVENPPIQIFPIKESFTPENTGEIIGTTVFPENTGQIISQPLTIENTSPQIDETPKPNNLGLYLLILLFLYLMVQ